MSFHRWRRDLFVAALASLLTSSVLVPIGWAEITKSRSSSEATLRMAEGALRIAKQKSSDADRAQDLAQRKLLGEAADLAGFGDPSEVEVMQVTTDAVAPEIPQGAYLLIDKKATTYSVGDILVFHAQGNNYLGRVLSQDSGRLTVGRNGEANRSVPKSEVAGLGVMNTR